MHQETLLEPSALQAILHRIDALQARQERLWGKLSLVQMLAHCQRPLMVAIGTHTLDKDLQSRVLSFLFGKMVKKKMLGAEPLAKGSPTAKSFLVVATGSLEEEREKLKQCIETFVAKANGGELGERHPFFGKMTQAEWDRLQWKHLDHHLRQFGV